VDTVRRQRHHRLLGAQQRVVRLGDGALAVRPGRLLGQRLDGLAQPVGGFLQALHGCRVHRLGAHDGAAAR
jgi:hypothetical protein